MDPIAEYLSGQYQDGHRESEGSFTVSSERALDQLSSHQLPRTSAWTLKMVQAGVAAGSRRIRVQQGASSCQFRFSGGEFGSLETLARLWFETDPMLTLPQKHLLVALRAVGFSRRRPVLIAQNCPQHGVRTLFWDGGKLRPIQDGSFRRSGSPGVGEIDFHVAGSPLGADKTVKRVRGLKDVVASEFRELQAHAVCCPVPVTVDARSVNHFGMQDVSMTRKPVAFSAQAPSSGSPSVLPLPEELYRAQPDLRGGAGLAWTLYSSTQAAPSRVCWVQSGVVCEEEALVTPASRFQVRLFLPADDLDTDLTALQLRFSEPVERAQRIGKAVEQFCAEIEGKRMFARFREVEEDEKRGPWQVSSVLLLAGLILSPFTAGISLFAGVGATIAIGFSQDSAGSPSRSDLDVFLANLRDAYRLPRAQGRTSENRS